MKSYLRFIVKPALMHVGIHYIATLGEHNIARGTIFAAEDWGP